MDIKHSEEIVNQVICHCNLALEPDPALITIMQMAFIWANEVGMNGDRVFDLELVTSGHLMHVKCKRQLSEDNNKKYIAQLEELKKQYNEGKRDEVR